MNITFLGHAGLFIETRWATILCDPWFNPAYLGSWFPFPSNEEVNLDAIVHPDFLYVSHLHQDHFDPAFLSEQVWKGTTVLLPDFPLGEMARELAALGFTRFIRTHNSEPMSFDGLTIALSVVASPADGPLGDSGLVVDDGEVRLFNQNDCRPVELDRLQKLGPFNAHFIQFSGASWYPFVYRYPVQTREALGRRKRANGMTRALRYARQIDALNLFPCAGPPCFLDDQLFSLNDFGDDPSNAFPDQRAFLSYLESEGYDRGRLVMPGDVISLQPDRCHIDHVGGVEREEAFDDKRAYLLRYQARRRDRVDAVRASLPRDQVDVVAELQRWFQPLLDRSDGMSVGIGGVVALDFGRDGVAIDFQRRQVEPLGGQDWLYYFKLDRSLVEYCIVHHLEDWVNELFLSFRFEAERKGPYNEFLFTFFKCLSMERLQYAEGYYAERSASDQFWEVAGYRVQRRCPHLKADLTKFGRIDNGILTCTLHGWQYELATGRSLTSTDTVLDRRPLSANGDEPHTRAGS